MLTFVKKLKIFIISIKRVSLKKRRMRKWNKKQKTSKLTNNKKMMIRINRKIRKTNNNHNKQKFRSPQLQKMNKKMLKKGMKRNKR